MQSQTVKIVLAVIITAVVASSGTYYFLSTKKTESPTFPMVSQKQEDITTDYNLGSKEYATMGRQVFSAFQCSSWASINDDQVEAERLFIYGYEQGQKFLGALSAQKIKQEDISSQVPIGVTMLLQGPSEEFILGRIHSSAEEDALDEVFKTGDDFNDDELQKFIASNKYSDGNCELLGK